MEEVIELKQYKRPKMVINPELNKYEDVVMFPKKLEEAKETIAKYGLPEGWEKKTSETKEQPAFWMSGILKRADAEANIFLIINVANGFQTHYVISTLPETLNKLVKAYWGEVIKVYIQPKAHEEQECAYELIEAKMD